MNPSTTFVALVHTAQKTGQVLLIISVLTLLLLIAAGAGLFHPASWQAGVQFAATNGEIHVNGVQFATTNGDIHIGG
jgi:hypothetical protein